MPCPTYSYPALSVVFGNLNFRLREHLSRLNRTASILHAKLGMKIDRLSVTHDECLSPFIVIDGFQLALQKNDDPFTTCAQWSLPRNALQEMKFRRIHLDLFKTGALYRFLKHHLDRPDTRLSSFVWSVLGLKVLNEFANSIFVTNFELRLSKKDRTEDMRMLHSWSFQDVRQVLFSKVRGPRKLFNFRCEYSTLYLHSILEGLCEREPPRGLSVTAAFSGTAEFRVLEDVVEFLPAHRVRQLRTEGLVWMLHSVDVLIHKETYTGSNLFHLRVVDKLFI